MITKIWNPVITLTTLITRSVAATSSIGFIVGPTSRHRIGRTASRLRLPRAAIETSGWQPTAMHGFFQDARDLLRERPMLGSRAAS